MRKRLIAAVMMLFIMTSFSGSGRLIGSGEMKISKTAVLPIAIASIETEKPYRLFEVSEMQEKADPGPAIYKEIVIENLYPVEKEKEIKVNRVTISSRSLGVSRGEVVIEYLFIENSDGQIVESDVSAESGIMAINRYFEEKGAPLAGYGAVFVRVSQKLKLDWRFLPAIAMRESTGGKNLFKPYNPFGWGSESFDSYNEAIETVGRHLAGHDPDTSSFYKEKTACQKLKKYNSAVKTYSDEVWGIMLDIERCAH
ncbi:MAG: hypothetical protein PHG66_02335 [Candidatus Colwellbacteria bacterium]|nr:hypothetical protein [Candidatus Colwellbacteria bacterium]